MLLTRCSYIRQKNSRTRLQMTKDNFQVLVSECHIFPQFAEYLIDFKWKKKETEIGPPRIRFHPFLDHDGNTCPGFGKFQLSPLGVIELTALQKSPTLCDSWSLRIGATNHHGRFVNLPCTIDPSSELQTGVLRGSLWDPRNGRSHVSMTF